MTDDDDLETWVRTKTDHDSKIQIENASVNAA